MAWLVERTPAGQILPAKLRQRQRESFCRLLIGFDVGTIESHHFASRSTPPQFIGIAPLRRPANINRVFRHLPTLHSLALNSFWLAHYLFPLSPSFHCAFGASSLVKVRRVGTVGPVRNAYHPLDRSEKAFRFVLHFLDAHRHFLALRRDPPLYRRSTASAKRFVVEHVAQCYQIFPLFWKCHVNRSFLGFLHLLVQNYLYKAFVFICDIEFSEFSTDIVVMLMFPRARMLLGLTFSQVHPLPKSTHTTATANHPYNSFNSRSA